MHEAIISYSTLHIHIDVLWCVESQWSSEKRRWPRLVGFQILRAAQAEDSLSTSTNSTAGRTIMLSCTMRAGRALRSVTAVRSSSAARCLTRLAPDSQRDLSSASALRFHKQRTSAPLLPSVRWLSASPDAAGSSAAAQDDVTAGGEQHEFQAETRQLLDIVTHSIYTDKEVFLRELISNASDAMEKLRQLQVMGEKLEGDGVPFEVSFTIQSVAAAVQRMMCAA